MVAAREDGPAPGRRRLDLQAPEERDDPRAVPPPVEVVAASDQGGPRRRGPSAGRSSRSPAPTRAASSPVATPWGPRTPRRSSRREPWGSADRASGAVCRARLTGARPQRSPDVRRQRRLAQRPGGAGQGPPPPGHPGRPVPAPFADRRDAGRPGARNQPGAGARGPARARGARRRGDPAVPRSTRAPAERLGAARGVRRPLGAGGARGAPRRAPDDGRRPGRPRGAGRGDAAGRRRRRPPRGGRRRRELPRAAARPGRQRDPRAGLAVARAVLAHVHHPRRARGRRALDGGPASGDPAGAAHARPRAGRGGAPPPLRRGQRPPGRRLGRRPSRLAAPAARWTPPRPPHSTPGRADAAAVRPDAGSRAPGPPRAARRGRRSRAGRRSVPTAGRGPGARSG